jgi:hypothetical protein
MAEIAGKYKFLVNLKLLKVLIRFSYILERFISAKRYLKLSIFILAW